MPTCSDLQVPFQLKEVDIKKPGNEGWFEEYKYDVPVIHANDEFLLWHRVNVDSTVSKLKAILAEQDKKQ
ncbi:hypothetical protein EC988_000852 [Linderina pennispora]|nr:hypothetical protein EC988_000852 [Linderina pennispora]